MLPKVSLTVLLLHDRVSFLSLLKSLLLEHYFAIFATEVLENILIIYCFKPMQLGLESLWSCSTPLCVYLHHQYNIIIIIIIIIKIGSYIAHFHTVHNLIYVVQVFKDSFCMLLSEIFNNDFWYGVMQI